MLRNNTSQSEAGELFNYAMEHAGGSTDVEPLFKRNYDAGSMRMRELTITKWYATKNPTQLVLGFDEQEAFAWVNDYDFNGTSWELRLAVNRSRTTVEGLIATLKNMILVSV